MSHSDSHIFSTFKSALLIALAYSLLLLLSLKPSYQLYISVFGMIGEWGMRLLLNSAFLLIGLAVVYFVWKRCERTPLVWIALAVIGVVLAWTLARQQVPANRIHFLQYGPLTLLYLDAVRHKINRRSAYFWVVLAVVGVSLLDESLQAITPERRFDPQDVGLNTVAALLVLAFVEFVLGWDRYPFGRSSANRGG